MTEIIIILLLILFNGVLAMSEIALISIRKSHLANEVHKGNQTARILMKLTEEPERFLSAIQIGITIIGILTGIYSGNVLADNLSGWLTDQGMPSGASHPIAQTSIVVLVTYLTLIFGELVPKRIGMSAAERTAAIIARPMFLLTKIASPFVWLLAKSTGFFFGMLGLENDSGKVTEEEIKTMIQEGTKGGEVQEVEQDIVERVFLLGDLKVSSLMTHRNEVIALDIGMSNKQIKEILEKEMYEMYPVINHDFDHVEGIVTLKSMMFNLCDSEFTLESILKPAIGFHENMSVYKALEEMKERQTGQALVYDEFGSCQGIITLKDILEGLVGTLSDSQKEPDIIKRTQGDGWLIDGQCPLLDFLAYFGKERLHTQINGFKTVSGLILEKMGHIPQSGESIFWNEFCFEIMDMDGARIDKILVKLHGEKASDSRSI